MLNKCKSSYTLYGNHTFSYHGESLTTDSARSSKDNGFTLTKAVFEQIKDEFVILHRVQIVDAVRVGAVVEYHIGVGDPFSKVGLLQHSALPSS